jgi:predicted RNase H-like nuclease (RuvC/YqgF family)
MYASLNQGNTILDALNELEGKIRDLEANHAQILKDKDAYIIDLQKSNTELESEKEALKEESEKNKLKISELQQGQTWLRLKVDACERKLKKEMAKNSSEEGAKEKLKKIKEQLTLIAGEVGEYE